MLVAPHQYDLPAYTVINTHLDWWGTALLLAGGALFAVLTLAPGRAIRAGAQFFTSGLLLGLALAFLQSAAWTGLIVSAMLGFAMAFAGVLPPPRGETGSHTCDLLALTVGLAMALVGGTLPVASSHFGGSVYDPIRAWLSWFGLAFLGSGVLLLAVNLVSNCPKALRVAAHMLAALALLLFVVTTTVPARAWSGLILGVDVATLLIVLPWLRPRVTAAVTTSLRTQLAFALGAAVTLSLLGGVVWSAQAEEAIVVAEVLLVHQTVAAHVAGDIDDFELEATVVAGLPGLLAMPPLVQAGLLRDSALPSSVRDYATFAADGTALARSDGRPLVNLTGAPLFTQVRSSRAPAIEFATSSLGPPTMQVVAPVLGAANHFSGVVLLESDQFITHLSGATVGDGGRIYLIDPQGQTIAASGAVPATFNNQLRLVPASQQNGTLSYAAGGHQWLTGWARITGSDWTVVVDQPSYNALADVRRHRELAFGALLAAAALAVLVGIGIAIWLVRPLRDLSVAMQAFSVGASPVFPRQSRIREVAYLTNEFIALYDRLAAVAAERERAEETRARLAAIVQSTSDAVIGLTLSGLVTSWNRGAKQMYGYDDDEIVGRSIVLLIPTDRSDEDTQFLDRLRRGEQIDHFETTRIRKDGERIAISLSLSPIVDADGQVIGVAEVAHDISDRQRAEEARLALAQEQAARAAAEELAEARAMYEALVLNLTDGLAVIDPDGRCAFWSPALERLTGVASSTAIGRTLGELVEIRSGDAAPLEEAQQRVASAAQAAVTSGTSVRFDLRPFGETPRYLSILAFPIVAVGRPARLGWLAQDVTRERELERLKDELIATVSHELRTPLSSLVGFSELLLTREYPRAEQQEFLTTMLQEGERLAALINDMLDLQRMASGRQHLHVGAVDVASVVDKALQAAGDDPAHPAEVLIPRGLPPVWADPAAIRRVLGNLLANARKYSPDGGPIRLTARVRDGTIEVAVRDHGVGIPPEALPQLFQRFYRVERADSRQIGGTGLGLAICREVVEAHGGRIWAESAGPGLGATFTFSLPVMVTDVPGKGDVLIVEDDLVFASLLAAELATRGWSSAVHISAESALAWLATETPRALLLDLLLPGLTGEQFLQSLHEWLPDLPVVVVTGLDLDAAARLKLAAQGVVQVLRKGRGVAAAAANTVAARLAGSGIVQPTVSKEGQGGTGT
jgi:PAS domain S-box-containing protein